MAKERVFLLGRSRTCDLVFDHESVSREHARVQITPNGQVFLTDMGSRNGTWLLESAGKRAIRQEVLSPTDRLSLGDVELPVAKMLEMIRLKFPEPVGSAVAAEPSRTIKPWVQGRNLVRCEACGAVKSSGSACTVCGR